MIKFSVIIPLYNKEKEIADTLNSVLNQSYKADEIIVVDDGSTDNSAKIIKEFMKKDQRIVLIDRENKGLPYSLNEGISKAKGEYIARMDADDISLPERFERQIKYMEDNNLDVCGTFIKVFSESSNKVIIGKNPINHNDIKFALLFFSSLAHPTVMFRKEVFSKVNYRVDYKVAQDYQLWIDIVITGYKVGNIPEVLLNYRQHEAQASIYKFKKQQDIAHEIALNYAEKLGEEIVKIVQQVIDSKISINYTNFKILLDKILKLSKDNSISKETLSFILKKLYLYATPKSPVKYYVYFKAKIDLQSY